jgi:hypothetical protein
VAFDVRIRYDKHLGVYHNEYAHQMPREIRDINLSGSACQYGHRLLGLKIFVRTLGVSDLHNERFISVSIRPSAKFVETLSATLATKVFIITNTHIKCHVRSETST